MTKITDKTVKSKYPPKQTNVTWIDTSQKPAVTKSYIDGKWVVVGGGGGTKKYSDLEEKPLINGVELDGNKTSSDLGMATSQQGEKADSGRLPARQHVYRGAQAAARDVVQDHERYR